MSNRAVESRAKAQTLTVCFLVGGVLIVAFLALRLALGPGKKGPDLEGAGSKVLARTVDEEGEESFSGGEATVEEPASEAQRDR